MFRILHDVNIDWLGKRRFFIGLSIVLLLTGMGSALYRHRFHPRGTEAFNLGVDFKGGTVVTVSFKQPPSVEVLRAAIRSVGINDAVIQPVLDKPGQFVIRVPQQEAAPDASVTQAGVDPARAKVGQAVKGFGEGNSEIVGTAAVGEVASKQLRTQAIAVTIAALIGMLIFIA